MSNIKFISPRDIKKGDTFTFEELFSVDDNVKAFQESFESKIKSLADSISKEKEQELKDRYQGKEEDLQEFYEKQVKSIGKDLEKDHKIDKANLEKEFAVYQERNKQLEEQLGKLEELYEDKFNARVQEIEKQKEELIKEYEAKQVSAAQIGEDGEESIRSTLKELWPNDEIIKPNHATGEADVLHNIVDDSGKTISSIYYEVKNRKN
ncbi:MAG: hypothetical protein ACK5MQ_02235 [Pikeienuella sp.]